MTEEAGPLETLFYAATLGLATGPLDHLILLQTVGPALRSALWGSVYAGFALLFLRWPSTAKAAAGSLWPVMGVMLLALLSTVWSDHPDQTLIGTVETSAVIWFGALMGRRLGERRLLKLVIPVLAGLAVLDLWAIFAGPAGFDINGDAVGLFSHKNQNGAIMATLTVAATAVLFWGGARAPALAGLLLAVPLCLLSGSRTSWLAALVGVGAVILPAMTTLRPASRLASLLAMVALLCLGGAVSLKANLNSLEAVLSAAGKDATLTGRTDLWELGRTYVRQAPLLGHGYDGFWSEDPASDAAFVNGLLKEDFASFHNGHLEMAVELGLFGALLQIAAVLAFLGPVRRLLKTGDPAAAAFALALFVLIALTSMSEVVLFLRHGFDLLLMSALWSAAHRQSGQGDSPA